MQYEKEERKRERRIGENEREKKRRGREKDRDLIMTHEPNCTLSAVFQDSLEAGQISREGGTGKIIFTPEVELGIFPSPTEPMIDRNFPHPS